jgi:hypothetical protein
LCTVKLLRWHSGLLVGKHRDSSIRS